MHMLDKKDRQKKKAEKQVVKEQIILEKPSQSLDDDIVVEW